MELFNCDELSIFFGIRYFLRKLKKVKKSNGQVLAINEVIHAWNNGYLLSLFTLSS